MSFWAYENWTNARKVTLHAGHCGFCKEGRGRSGKGTKPENGRWLGPFESLDAARAAAEALPPATISEDRCCSDSALRRQATTKLGVHTDPEDRRPSDYLLLGCSSEKLPGRAAARDLYASPRFQRRRRYAEASAKPWAIVSAKHGLVDPNELIDPYNLSLDALSDAERATWAAGVAAALEARYGRLGGRTFELHASRLYGDPLEPELRRRGAHLTRPLRHVSLYQEAAWYAGHGRAYAPPSAEARRVRVLRPAAPGIAKRLTEAFMTGAIDLSERTETAPVGWEGVPEVPAAAGLRKAGASELQVRLFLTLTTALDRARDAGRLWAGASALFAATPEAFDPAYVLAHVEAVAAGLRKHGVSQRHGPDVAAWMTLAGTVASLPAGSQVRRALWQGEGDAKAILAERSQTSASGKPLYPMIRGPKIGPMWVRMLAYPGGARLSNLAYLPVAVDVQVRRATENLGVADTAGMLLDEARPIIQRAWRDDVAAAGAAGPPGLENTCAALDPALWFFGKYGCSYCETVGSRRPVAAVCSNCRLDLSTDDEVET